jgi:hypothetical protein
MPPTGEQGVPLMSRSYYIFPGRDPKFGNIDTGNHLTIRASDGFLQAEGTATCWDDLRFPVTGINPAGAAAPPTLDDSSFFGTLLFSASATNIIAGQAQMPHHWREGSSIYPHVHWAPTSTNTGAVLWRLGYQVADVNGTFPGSFTEIDSLDPADGTTNKHQIAAFPAVSMTGAKLSAMILWTLSRIGGDGTDDYTGTARLLEVDFHYEVDSFGSSAEYEKRG